MRLDAWSSVVIVVLAAGCSRSSADAKPVPDEPMPSHVAAAKSGASLAPKHEKVVDAIVDPARLQAFGLTMHDVLAALNEAGHAATTLPAGDAAIGRVRFADPSEDPQVLLKVVVAQQKGAPVRLSDVASVQVGRAD